METEETKRDRFKRVGGNRVNDLLEKIRLLGNCANTSNYSYTHDEINKIFTTIYENLQDTRKKFKVEGERFSL